MHTSKTTVLIRDGIFRRKFNTGKKSRTTPLELRTGDDLVGNRRLSQSLAQ
jgi:hypothetical protein